MKKLYPLLFILFLISCEDVLKEEPKSIAMQNFYNTSGEVATAVNAIYPPIVAYNAFGFLYPAQLNCYDGEFFTGRGSYAPLSDFVGLNSTNITRIGSMWTQFYLGIRNANIVIENAPKGTKISDTDKAKYVGEAKFMRALIYFYMIRNWNKVVLRTESNMTESNVPLSDAATVYALIVEDLKYAEENLPEAPSVAGHPSKWSAKSVLADVYFYQAQYTDAMNKSKEVIDSKKYSLVEISKYEDWQKIFGATVTNSTEEVFYLKFSREPGYGWSEVGFFHHPNDPWDTNKAGLFAQYMADSTACTWYQNEDKADLRRKFWYYWNIGWGPTTMLYNKFYDNTSTTGNAGNDYPLYRYGDVLLLYAEAACRANNGPTADAMEKLNMVHRRAFGKNSLTPSEVDFKLADYSSSQSFIDLVLKERGYETAGEAKRWLDLKRLGIVKDKIKAATGKTVADKHLLWPIPVSEMDYNTAIDPVADQNPGY
ncbi:MAG: RagB/SusD family nutrient uptake outer membrane protein [Bacteroidales bacterium]|nr:RagB/SusD family nutrient uptake outer membrane protein [Bacteroidales bacterium]